MDPTLPHAFLITSFDRSPELLAARRRGIDAAARRYGFPVLRVDELPGPRPVIDATHERIATADFVVADLTGGKPNCYYEVGYARALDRPLILVIKDGEIPHFDLAGLPFVMYRDPTDLREKLANHIYNDVLTTHARPSHGDNAWRYGGHAFQYPYRVTGRVRQDPDTQDEQLTFLVNVRVDSVDPKQPLTGRVTFHLHEDFRYPTESFDATQGYAELVDVPAAETFTVGVEIVKPGVELELDLTRVPGSTAVFRRR